MFWKRNAPTPSGSVPVSERGDGDKNRPGDADSAEAVDRPASGNRELDAAIDAVVGLLKAFGEHAFDTDNVSADDTRGECDGWARKISLAEQVGVEGGQVRRDFGGARRYFVAHRAHER
jgi:hypothetical protein